MVNEGKINGTHPPLVQDLQSNTGIDICALIALTASDSFTMQPQASLKPKSTALGRARMCDNILTASSHLTCTFACMQPAMGDQLQCPHETFLSCYEKKSMYLYGSLQDALNDLNLVAKSSVLDE